MSNTETKPAEQQAGEAAPMSDIDRRNAFAAAVESAGSLHRCGLAARAVIDEAGRVERLYIEVVVKQ